MSERETPNGNWRAPEDMILGGPVYGPRKWVSVHDTGNPSQQEVPTRLLPQERPHDTGFVGKLHRLGQVPKEYIPK